MYLPKPPKWGCDFIDLPRVEESVVRPHQGGVWRWPDDVPVPFTLDEHTKVPLPGEGKASPKALVVEPPEGYLLRVWSVRAGRALMPLKTRAWRTIIDGHTRRARRGHAWFQVKDTLVAVFVWRVLARERWYRSSTP